MEQKVGFEKAPGLDDLALRMKLGLRLSRQRLLANEPLPRLISPHTNPPRAGFFKRLVLFPWYFLKRRIESMIRERMAPLEQQLAQHHEKILELELHLEFLESNSPITNPQLPSRQSSWKHLTP